MSKQKGHKSNSRLICGREHSKGDQKSNVFTRTDPLHSARSSSMLISSSVHPGQQKVSSRITPWHQFIFSHFSTTPCPVNVTSVWFVPLKRSPHAFSFSPHALSSQIGDTYRTYYRNHNFNLSLASVKSSK